MIRFDDEWQAQHLATLIPCSLCRTPTPARDLRERWVVGIVVEVVPGCEIAPRTAVWLCPACPEVGE